MKKFFDIEKSSENIIKINVFKKEWKPEYYSALFFRIMLSIISIYTAYSLVLSYAKIFLKINVLAIIVALLLLTFFEFWNVRFQAKFLKFLLNMLWINAIYLLFPVLLFFGISFYTSTNGVALLASNKIDTGKEIKEKYDNKEKAVMVEYAKLIEPLQLENNQILSNINPEIELLQRKQINRNKTDIKVYQTKRDSIINTINAAYKAEQKVNRNNVQHEASKYYNIVAIFIAFQFLISLFVAIIANRVHKEAKPHETLKFNVQNLVFDYKTILEKAILQENENARLAINAMLKNEQSFNVANTQNLIPETSRKVGFSVVENVKNNVKIQRNDDNRIYENRMQAKNNDENNAKNNVKNEVKDTNVVLRKCAYFGKEYVHNHHKQIYCTDDCRKKSYADRTGRKLYLYKNKHKSKKKK